MKLIPAMRGRIGSTEYFIATMKANEVVSTVKIPKEMPDWDNESIEERYQREINYKRVKEQIAPYLANDDDRFFNALIVDILDGDSVAFDSDIVKLPTIAADFGSVFGILKLSGKERLVPLDGQHRLKALQFAINGRDEKDQPIETYKSNPKVGDDDIVLILVKHDRIKARKIFNKVNRYAKPTSKADNLIINEDDYVAVISRNISNSIFKGLVNSTSNTIAPKSNDITTLSVIYEASLDYITESPLTGGVKPDISVLPDEQTKNLWKRAIEDLWVTLLKEIPVLADAISDISEVGKNTRIELRENYIIMKPIVQASLINAIKRLVVSGVSMKSVIEKVSNIDWRFENPIWDRIAVEPGKKIIAGNQKMKVLGRYLAYILGDNLTSKELEVLEKYYRDLFDGDESKKLPEKIT
jgi:DNA sulfur modification protein DndB